MDGYGSGPFPTIDTKEGLEAVIEMQARELRRLVEENHALRTYKIQRRGTLEFVLAQLRHAYRPLCHGEVKNQQELAAGLIAPAIRRLEELQGD